MKNQLFTPKVVLLLIAGAVVLFALSILLSVYDSNPVAPANKARPDSYSASAIGHAGFYDTMRRLNMPIMRSIGNTLYQVGANGTLIVAEPDVWRLTSRNDAAKLVHAPRLLLVLPKWQGSPDERRPGWVADVKPAPLFAAQQTLALVAGTNSIVIRDDWPTTWQHNEIGVTPAQTTPVVQMIRSDQLRPVVGTANGMLVGEIIEKDRIIWVLSDPDVMSNYGFGQGDNAVFAITMLNALRHWNNTDSAAPIVFDEVVHGFEQPESSPVRLIVTFPYSIITILICLSGIFAALAGVSRFGAPRRPKPDHDFGKAGLIHNGARLLDYAGHHTGVLQRYVRMTIFSVGQSLHAPPNLSDAALAQWLDRIGKARQLKTSCAAILAAATQLNKEKNQNLARLFKSAWEIHNWKGEMLNGSAVNRRDS